MNVFITAIAYLTSLAVVAIVSFFLVILLAGPHAGLLPELLEELILVLGWASVLGLPVITSYKVWRYLEQREKAENK